MRIESDCCFCALENLFMGIITFLNSNKEYIIGGLSLPICVGYFLQQCQNCSICLENYRVFNGELDAVKERFIAEHRKFFEEHIATGFFSTSISEVNKLFDQQERALIKKWIEFNIENKKLVLDFFFWLYSSPIFWLNCKIIKEAKVKKDTLARWLIEQKQRMLEDLNKRSNCASSW